MPGRFFVTAASCGAKLVDDRGAYRRDRLASQKKRTRREKLRPQSLEAKVQVRHTTLRVPFQRRIVVNRQNR